MDTQHGRDESSSYPEETESKITTKKVTSLKSRRAQLFSQNKFKNQKNTGRGSTVVPVSSRHSNQHLLSSLHSPYTSTINSPEIVSITPKPLLNQLTNPAQDTLLQATMFGNKRPPGRGKSSFLHPHMNITCYLNLKLMPNPI